MGWGFPAAIGAKAAKPDVPVVDIAGDGSFNMTENSLSDMQYWKTLPVIVFLINNYTLRNGCSMAKNILRQKNDWC